MNLIRNSFFKRLLLLSCSMLIILMISIFFSLTIGSSAVNIKDVLGFFFGFNQIDYSESILVLIIWHIRLPRILLSVLVGGALSLGGLTLQAVLRNPLAEPYILGISGGSAIGAIFGILFGFNRFPGVTLTAFVGSLLSVTLSLLLVSKSMFFNKNSLILIGVMVNAFCSAIIMLFISITHDYRLHSIIFWLMGDFSTITFRGLFILMFLLIFFFVLLFILSNWMNLLQFGPEIAQSTGMNVRYTKMILLLCVSFMISITVSYCGLVGFVGLVVPHVLRILLGGDHRILVPSCILCGAIYLVLCDAVTRIFVNYGEVPIGVITSLIGAPIFVYLIIRSNYD